MSLSMGMGPAWRHMRTDRSSVKSRVEKGTVRRVLKFAVPHRGAIAGFLGVTVLDSLLIVVTPLLVQRIVDDGILAGNNRMVTLLALAMAGVAIFTAALAVLNGWLSSRIGEGLIYDLRTKVFGHVQRQSLAFFTRTQTGALTVAAVFVSWSRYPSALESRWKLTPLLGVTTTAAYPAEEPSPVRLLRRTTPALAQPLVLSRLSTRAVTDVPSTAAPLRKTVPYSSSCCPPAPQMSSPASVIVKWPQLWPVLAGVEEWVL